MEQDVSGEIQKTEEGTKETQELEEKNNKEKENKGETQKNEEKEEEKCETKEKKKEIEKTEEKEINVTENTKEKKKRCDLFEKIEEDIKQNSPIFKKEIKEEAKAEFMEISSSINPSSLEDCVQKIKSLVNDCLYDEALTLTEKVKSNENFDLKSLPMKDQYVIVDVEETCKHINEVCQYLNDEEGWSLDSSNSFVTTKYKQYPNSKSYTMKMEGELNFPIENMCSIVYEIEYFNEFVPFCNRSYTLKPLGKGSKLCYFLLDIPFWSNREGYIRGIGVDRIEIDNTILIISKTIDEDKKMQQRLDFEIPTIGNADRLKMDHFCFEMKPISKNKFRLRSLLNIEPKVAFLPQFVLNFFTRKIGAHMFSKLLKLAENMDEKKWTKIHKKEESKEYYQWINKRVDYFEKRKKEELEKAEELEKDSLKPVRI